MVGSELRWRRLRWPRKAKESYAGKKAKGRAVAAKQKALAHQEAGRCGTNTNNRDIPKTYRTKPIASHPVTTTNHLSNTQFLRALAVGPERTVCALNNIKKEKNSGMTEILLAREEATPALSFRVGSCLVSCLSVC
eukprot:1922619-Amphidinium_carterae.1